MGGSDRTIVTRYKTLKTVFSKYVIVYADFTAGTAIIK